MPLVGGGVSERGVGAAGGLGSSPKVSQFLFIRPDCANQHNKPHK